MKCHTMEPTHFMQKLKSSFQGTQKAGFSVFKKKHLKVAKKLVDSGRIPGREGSARAGAITARLPQRVRPAGD